MKDVDPCTTHAANARGLGHAVLVSLPSADTLMDRSWPSGRVQFLSKVMARGPTRLIVRSDYRAALRRADGQITSSSVRILR